MIPAVVDAAASRGLDAQKPAIPFVVVDGSVAVIPSDFIQEMRQKNNNQTDNTANKYQD